MTSGKNEERRHQLEKEKKRKKEHIAEIPKKIQLENYETTRITKNNSLHCLVTFIGRWRMI